MCGVDEGSPSSTLSQCSTLEDEEEFNALERIEGEMLMDGTNEDLDVRRYTANAAMLKQLVQIGLSKDDAEMALHQTRWRNVSLATDWHFQHRSGSA